jgi:fumarate hydratase subunit beta
MKEAKRVKSPLKRSDVLKLRAGQQVLLSGAVFTARDQAHKRLVELINKGKKLPFNLQGEIIYYCGPTAAARGKPIGSCGPTTASRMDEFAAPLFKQGLLGMIGKGRRRRGVRDLIRKYRTVYFIAPAGCGALLAKRVKSRRIVSFKELGPEAIYRLEVADFPLIVGIDSSGQSIYPDL